VVAALGAIIALALVPFPPRACRCRAMHRGRMRGCACDVSLIWLFAGRHAIIKANGPVALGGRELPARFQGVIALMAVRRCSPRSSSFDLRPGGIWRRPEPVGVRGSRHPASRCHVIVAVVVPAGRRHSLRALT